MKKKQEKISENYLLRVPVHPEELVWSVDENNLVTIEIENKGAFKRITQLILRKPKTSYIHLDKHGSFTWLLVDGKKDIIELGKLVEAEFGEDANPLYERLATYFQILDSYHFIAWNNKE